MVEEIPYDEIIDETCPSCRHTVPRGSGVCPYCGYRIREEEKPESREVGEPPKVSVRTSGGRAGLAGALILVSGILALITGIYMMADPGSVLQMYSDIGYEFTEEIVAAAGAITVIFGIIAVIGGAMAIRRKHWGVAVAGGVFAFLGSGLFFIGTLLGLIGLILVIVARREFSS